MDILNYNQYTESVLTVGSNTKVTRDAIEREFKASLADNINFHETIGRVIRGLGIKNTDLEEVALLKSVINDYATKFAIK